MANMSGVNELLHGLKRINQLKNEVEIFVELILRIISEYNFFSNKPYNGPYRFHSHGLEWVIEQYEDKPSIFEVAVVVGTKEIFSSVRGRTHISDVYTEKLHQGLPDFLKKIKEIFPEHELTGALSPYVKAASKD